MGKKLLPLIIVFALGMAIGAGIVLKSCGPDKAYWIERAVYDRDVKARDDSYAAAMGLVAEKDIVISESAAALSKSAEKVTDLERMIMAGSQAVASQDREIERLKTDASAVIAANPAIKALVNAYEVQIANYKSQVFSLAQQVQELGVPQEAGTDPQTGEKIWIYPEGTITFQLHRQLLATAAQRDAWHAQYEEEHGLRLSCDSLRLGLEKKLYGGKLWKYIALGETTIFGAIAFF